jgi:hypothetical protein
MNLAYSSFHVFKSAFRNIRDETLSRFNALWIINVFSERSIRIMWKKKRRGSWTTPRELKALRDEDRRSKVVSYSRLHFSVLREQCNFLTSFQPTRYSIAFYDFVRWNTRQFLINVSCMCMCIHVFFPIYNINFKNYNNLGEYREIYLCSYLCILR